MAYIINDIIKKPRMNTAVKKLDCFCAETKNKPQIYNREGIVNKLDAAKEVKEELNARNRQIDENIRKHGEAAKAYFLAKK